VTGHTPWLSAATRRSPPSPSPSQSLGAWAGNPSHLCVWGEGGRECLWGGEGGACGLSGRVRVGVQVAERQTRPRTRDTASWRPYQRRHDSARVLTPPLCRAVRWPPGPLAALPGGQRPRGIPLSHTTHAHGQIHGTQMSRSADRCMALVRQPLLAYPPLSSFQSPRRPVLPGLGPSSAPAARKL
jgi:hypothetical protein